jgi:hypothetical protein
MKHKVLIALGVVALVGAVILGTRVGIAPAGTRVG